MMASYGTFGETRRRRRRNAWWSVFRFLSALVAVLAVGVYAYQVGVSANQTRTAQLEADLARAQHDNLDLHDRMASAAEQQADAGGGAGEHAAALCCGDSKRRSGRSARPVAGAAERRRRPGAAGGSDRGRRAGGHVS